MIKEILVTGGAGYVGSALIEPLLNKYPDSKVVVFDNISKGKFEACGYLSLSYEGRVEIIKADLRDSHVVESVFQNHHFDTVIHLAAIVDAFNTNRPGKDLETKQVNYEATLVLAELAKKYGVKNFIYQSSCSVYSLGENIKEDDEKRPISAYGQYKLFGEKIIDLVDDNFRMVILRPATIFGYAPGFRYETVINYFAVRAFYGFNLPAFKDALDNKKTYLGIHDNVKAILFSLDNIERFNGHVFNAVSFSINLRELLAVLEEVYGKIDVKLIDSANVSQQTYTVSGDKFYRRGFKPDANLKEEIIKIKKYLEEQKNILETKDFWKKPGFR